MLFDGIKLVEGSELQNVVVDGGTVYPANPDDGELFYRQDTPNEGMYIYQAATASWVRFVDGNDDMSGLLPNSGVTAGTYKSVTVSEKGLVTAGTNPTTLAGYGITDAQPLDADLTSIAGLTATSGVLRKTNADTWTLDTSVYLTGNQSVTLTGDATGSGATTIAVTLANTGVAAGAYGSSSNIPSLTIDSKGRVLTASSNPVAIDASAIVSGQLADARISQSSITQHQSSVSVAESQITDGLLLARNAGNEIITGNWTFNNVVTGQNPTVASHLATKAYVDNVAQGLTAKNSVEVATTANISLSSLQTIDGVSVVDGARVLVKNQTNAIQNGVYVASTGAWTRAEDMDGTPTNDVAPGNTVFVEQGTASGNTTWVITNTTPISLGTTPITWSLLSRIGGLSVSGGLTLSGNDIAVASVSPSRIVVNANNIDLATTGVTAGTYKSVSVDSYGRVTTGTNPTTLAGYGITDAQPLDADLSSIAGLAGTTGFLKKTAANTWALDTAAYLTGNQTVTVSGDATGSGTTSIPLTLANSGVTAGTYRSVTVDAKGRVTAGTNPTTLSGYGITDALTTAGGQTVAGSMSLGGIATYSGYSSQLTITYTGNGSQYGIALKPASSVSSTNALTFLDSSASTEMASIRHLSSNSGMMLAGNWSLNGATFITSANIGSQTATNVSGVVAIANGGTGSTSAEAAIDALGGAAINPASPKDGDIRITAGPVISIYATGAWRQVFPAVYS